MNKTKSLAQRSAKIIANMALASSTFAANSRCVCIYHQPKIPKDLHKLKKV